MGQLDGEELFSLAVKASQEGDADTAIRYFKESLELAPKPETRYLLGAEYAGLKMYPRAVECMQDALSEMPELYTARMQIALIHIVTDDLLGAKEALEPLLGDIQPEFFGRFAEGLTAFIERRNEDARNALEAGIQLNEANPALNGDMLKIINFIDQQSGTSEEAAQDDSNIGDAASQYLMSKYQKPN